MADSYFKFDWYTGVVKDRNDPAKLGRLRVKIIGVHDESIPTEELEWAEIIMPTTGINMFSLPKIGEWVLVSFRDIQHRKYPFVFGIHPGILSEEIKTPDESSESLAALEEDLKAAKAKLASLQAAYNATTTVDTTQQEALVKNIQMQLDSAIAKLVLLEETAKKTLLFNLVEPTRAEVATLRSRLETETAKLNVLKNSSSSNKEQLAKQIEEQKMLIADLEAQITLLKSELYVVQKEDFKDTRNQAQVNGDAKPASGIVLEVKDTPSIPRLARGDSAQSAIARSNASLAHVCDFRENMRYAAAWARIKFEGAVTAIRDAIKAILKALGYSPDGVSARFIEIAKSILDWLKKIQRVIARIKDFGYLIVDFTKKVRAMIDWILGLPERLKMLLKQCLTELYASLSAGFKELLKSSGVSETTGTAGEAVQVLQDLKTTTATIVSDSVKVIAIPGAVLNAITNPASAADISAAGNTITSFITTSSNTSATTSATSSISTMKMA